MVFNIISFLLMNSFVQNIVYAIFFVLQSLKLPLENLGDVSNIQFFCNIALIIYLSFFLGRRAMMRRKESTTEIPEEISSLEKRTFTKKMKNKSKKIVLDAEKGEAKQAIEKCKKFLSLVESSSFKCKIFVNSWEVRHNLW